MQSKARRRFLHAAVAGAGATLCFGSRGFGQSIEETLRDDELRGGLILLGGAGGNIVLLDGPSGVAMVDSGSPEHGSRVMRFLTERFGDAGIEVLLNTHWHLEHTGANEAVGRAGTRIVAHENTRLWMSTEFYVDWEDRTYQPRPAAARPTETFYSSASQPIEIAAAGQRIEYGLMREAHTDGDIYVRFTEQNVIVAGGAVTVGRYPVLDYATGGLINGLLDATRMLIEMSDADTLIIPAMGPPQRRSDLESQLDMLGTVRERIQTLGRQGKSVKEMLAEGVTSDFDARWGNNAGRFVANIYSSIWGLGR